MTSVLDDAVAGNGLVAAYQRLVSLPTQRVVGYEALARWPGVDGLMPLDVISHAERTGRLDLLDRACIRAAARGALDARAAPDMLLLVNSEPATDCAELVEDPWLKSASEAFRLVFEITERGRLADPPALQRKIAMLREAGIAIALDDVGADDESLALIDMVAPDIVKLDMEVVQQSSCERASRTIAAVRRYADRTGAVICAEGIETSEHLAKALAWGAALGQGWMFGKPGEL